MVFLLAAKPANHLLGLALHNHAFQQDLVGTANDLTNTFTYNPANQVVTLNKSNTSYNYVGNANRADTYDNLCTTE